MDGQSVLKQIKRAAKAAVPMAAGFTMACYATPFVDGDDNEHDAAYEETARTCSDGLDNDGNGATDCADRSCAPFDFCGAEACGDGLDNDGDGAVDCDDTQCLSLCHCQQEESPPELLCPDDLCPWEPFDWAQSFGQPGEERLLALESDPHDDGVFLGGSSSSDSMRCGGEPVELLREGDGDGGFLCKLDGSGAHLWSVALGSSVDALHYDEAAEVLYVAGSSPHGDVFVAGLDMDGTVLWRKGFGGDGHEALTALATDPQGNLYLTGAFASGSLEIGSEVLRSSGSEDLLLAKLDPEGNVLWVKSASGQGQERGTALVVDQAGTVFLGGIAYESEMDLGGSPLPSAGNYDALLAAFSSAGEHLWSQSFGGENADVISALATGPGGALHVAGYFGSTEMDLGGGPLRCQSPRYDDLFVARFDQNGAHLSSASYGWRGTDRLWSIAVDGTDNVVVTGDFSSVTLDMGGGCLNRAAPSWASFVASFGPAGNHLWSMSLPATGTRVAATGSGAITLAGSFVGAMSTDLFELESAGESDLFVARF